MRTSPANARCRPSTVAAARPRAVGFACRSAVRAVPLLCTLAFLAACDRQEDTAAPVEYAAPAAMDNFNVVVVLIDTLRADHLGAYGYKKPTSPFIDSLSERGVVFDQAYAPSSFTRESISALFTGRLPSESGAAGWAAHPLGPTLGTRFKEAGFATGFFGESVVVNHPAYTRGFDEVQVFNLTNADREHAPKLSERALKFVEGHGANRFLMYVHFLDPHGEYYPPSNYASRFVAQPPEVPLTLYETRQGVINVRAHRNELLARGFAPGQKDFEDWVGAYDAEIAYVDDALRQLVEGMDALGVLDRTLLVVTSDHGEEFFEHGYVEHAWTLYNESTHVPLIFHAPGALPAARVQGPVSSVRVLPTLAELISLPAANPPALPLPLFRRGDRKMVPVAEFGPVISENHIEFRNSSIALRDGDWKYVAWMRWIPPGARHNALDIDESRLKVAVPTPPPLRQAVVREELFDLSHDPGEQQDLSGTRPAELERMRGLLDQYRKATEAAGSRPTVPGDDGSRETLESLGYL